MRSRWRASGYALCLAARTFEELEETRRLTALEPERSLIVLIDLAAEESPETLVATALDHFGRLDVLVNNAGWAPARTPLHKISGADQDRMLAVNLRAPIALTRLAAPPMIAQRSGAIVNIASAAGRTPPAFETVYAASKAGLIAFTHACFAELRERGIKAVGGDSRTRRYGADSAQQKAGARPHDRSRSGRGRGHADREFAAGRVSGRDRAGAAIRPVAHALAKRKFSVVGGFGLGWPAGTPATTLNEATLGRARPPRQPVSSNRPLRSFRSHVGGATTLARERPGL